MYWWAAIMASGYASSAALHALETYAFGSDVSKTAGTVTSISTGKFTIWARATASSMMRSRAAASTCPRWITSDRSREA